VVLAGENHSSAPSAKVRDFEAVDPEGLAMTILHRRCLLLAGAAIAVPATWRNAWAQAPQAGPKLTEVLRADLQGQNQKVEETVVNVLDMGPGVAAPWHMHPGAQEIIFVLDGSLIVDVEGQAIKIVRTGETALIPAEIPHLARNESTTNAARALVVHSRADKAKPFLVPVKRAI
jgi:quercetin dioxygenase-like cupin family protein